MSACVRAGASVARKNDNYKRNPNDNPDSDLNPNHNPYRNPHLNPNPNLIGKPNLSIVKGGVPCCIVRARGCVIAWMLFCVRTRLRIEIGQV